MTALREIFSRSTREAEAVQLRLLCEWTQKPLHLSETNIDGFLSVLDKFCQMKHPSEHLMLALSCKVHLHLKKNAPEKVAVTLQQLCILGSRNQTDLLFVRKPVLLNTLLESLNQGLGIKDPEKSSPKEFLQRLLILDKYEQKESLVAFLYLKSKLVDPYLPEIVKALKQEPIDNRSQYYKIIPYLAALASSPTCLHVLKQLSTEIKFGEKKCIFEYEDMLCTYHSLICRLTPEKSMQIIQHLSQLVGDKNNSKTYFVYDVLTLPPLEKFLAEEKTVKTIADFVRSNLTESTSWWKWGKLLKMWNAIITRHQDKHLHLDFILLKLKNTFLPLRFQVENYMLKLLPILFQQKQNSKEDSRKYIHQWLNTLLEEIEKTSMDPTAVDRLRYYYRWMYSLLIRGGFKWIDLSTLWQLTKRASPHDDEAQIASSLTKVIPADEIFAQLFLPSLREFVVCLTREKIEAASEFIEKNIGFFSIETKQMIASLLTKTLLHLSPHSQDIDLTRSCILVCKLLAILNTWKGNEHHLQTCQQYLHDLIRVCKPCLEDPVETPERWDRFYILWASRSALQQYRDHQFDDHQITTSPKITKEHKIESNSENGETQNELLTLIGSITPRLKAEEKLKINKLVPNFIATIRQNHEQCEKLVQTGRFKKAFECNPVYFANFLNQYAPWHENLKPQEAVELLNISAKHKISLTEKVKSVLERIIKPPTQRRVWVSL